ncbi:hypothetical protein C8J56DRAFT_963688 [Mycena floridula]|nr:hypothetical protein C8J56DRAFT_963688 [Mycena floridula]
MNSIKPEEVSWLIFAHLWDETGIKICHFVRNSIPYDITIGKSHPRTWETPVRVFLPELDLRHCQSLE